MRINIWWFQKKVVFLQSKCNHIASIMHQNRYNYGTDSNDSPPGQSGKNTV